MNDISLGPIIGLIWTAQLQFLDTPSLGQAIEQAMDRQHLWALRQSAWVIDRVLIEWQNYGLNSIPRLFLPLHIDQKITLCMTLLSPIYSVSSVLAPEKLVTASESDSKCARILDLYTV